MASAPAIDFLSLSDHDEARGHVRLPTVPTQTKLADRETLDSLSCIVDAQVDRA